MFPLQEVLQKIEFKLKEKFKENLFSLVLFGSYARGEEKENSDLDLLIVFKTLPESKLERTKLMNELLENLEENYDIAINPLTLTLSQLSTKSPLLIDIAPYSQIIFDKNDTIKHFFAEILELYKKGEIKKIYRKEGYLLHVPSL